MRKRIIGIRDPGNSAVTLIELVVVVGIFLAMITALTPFVRMAKERSQKIACANNLRRISLGLHSYAADHGGVFPPALENLYPNYVDDEKAFDCLSTKPIGTKSNPNYEYKTGLTEDSSMKDMIVQDAEGNHKNTGKNILRINGSVEWQ